MSVAEKYTPSGLKWYLSVAVVLMALLVAGCGADSVDTPEAEETPADTEAEETPADTEAEETPADTGEVEGSDGFEELYDGEQELYEAAREEGTVVWYEGGPPEDMRSVADLFEERYEGITVEVNHVAGIGQYQRFLEETEAGQHTADYLQLPDRPSMESLIEAGHIFEGDVPTHDRFDDPFRLSRHAYAVYVTDTAILYREGSLTDEEIEILSSGWHGVLDPRFEGRFSVTTAQCGTCYMPVNMFLDPDLEDEYGEEFMREVAAQNPTILPENTLIQVDPLLAGETDFTYWNWESIGITQRNEGADIRWIHPDPTPLAALTWYAASAHAPHPNAAELFHYWMLSEEGAFAHQEEYGGATTLEGFEDARPVAEEPWYDPIDERYDVDFDRWAENYTEDMETWINILEGG